MENHNEKEMIKIKNDLEIANMLLFEKIEKEIEDVIYEGIDQYTFYISENKTNFWYKHKKKFFEEYVIPHLTIHQKEKDDRYSCYKNGFYYYKNDCMCPYEVVYDNDLTLYFTRFEEDYEVEESDEESDEDSIEDDDK